MILAGALLGFEGEAETTFKIAIQLGAILAVIVAYRHRFLGVAVGLGRGEAGPFAFVRNILLAFAPAVVIGAFAYRGIRFLLESPEVVAAALVAGGLAMLLLERLVTRVRFDAVEVLPVRVALLIGLAQCLAMIPGVSRSGATILGGLALGLERRTAAEFSFFLAVPTMVAATSYDLYRNWASLSADNLGAIGIGSGVAFLAALIVVKAFVGIVSRFGFAPFAWYRIVLGLVALAWLASR